MPNDVVLCDDDLLLQSPLLKYIYLVLVLIMIKSFPSACNTSLYDITSLLLTHSTFTSSKLSAKFATKKIGCRFLGDKIGNQIRQGREVEYYFMGFRPWFELHHHENKYAQYPRSCSSPHRLYKDRGEGLGFFTSGC